MLRLKPKATSGRVGFTLIEIMFAIVISSIALLALMGVFEFQQRVYVEQAELARVQANLRAGMQYVISDLRMAGYTSIPLGFDRMRDPDTAAAFVPNDPVFPIITLKDGSTMLNNGTLVGSDLDIFDASQAYDNDSITLDDLTDIANLNDTFEGTDMIEVWGNFTHDWTTFLSGQVYNETETIIKVEEPELLVNNQVEWILIGDDSTLSDHQITGINIATKEVTFTPGLPTSFSWTDTIVSPYMRRVYFINTLNEDTTGSKVAIPMPQLIRRRYIFDYDNSTPAYTDEVLAEYVYNLQLEYIVNTGVNNEIREDAKIVRDPCTIRGVRIVLTAFNPRTARQSDDKIVPIERQLSQTVRVRNIGIDKTSCRMPGTWTGL